MKKWLAILVICGVLTASVFARPDRNAFINVKAETTAQLVAQAKRDKSVMDRYMRHYGMTRNEVIEYLSTLKPDTIKEEGVYAIYSVPEGGRIKMHLERLKKGHKVFAQQDGTPQLILKCGNPLTLGPKNVVALNRTPVSTMDREVEENPLTFTPEVEAEVVPVETLEPKVPFYEPPVIESNPVVPIPVAGFNPLPLALGGLAFLDNGGGGEPVPEPMTMAVFGAGLAYLGMRKRRAAKK